MELLAGIRKLEIKVIDEGPTVSICCFCNQRLLPGNPLMAHPISGDGSVTPRIQLLLKVEWLGAEQLKWKKFGDNSEHISSIVYWSCYAISEIKISSFHLTVDLDFNLY